MFPAFGIEGGAAGAAGAVRINDQAVDPKRQYILRHGDRVLLATPGGGGHGDLCVRDPAALDADRVEGYIDAGVIDARDVDAGAAE